MSRLLAGVVRGGESRRRCRREADGGRGWIDAGCPHRRADNDDCPRTWINPRPLSSLYVALLGRVSRSGIGVYLGRRRRTRKMTAMVCKREIMTRER
jgi:hypothetical protein